MFVGENLQDEKILGGGLEVSDKKTGQRERVDPDNQDEEIVHYCMQKQQRILNPIIDWTTDEVWEFIREYNIPYCSLYDEGFTRLGCIGCPFGTVKAREEQFKRYPKYKEAYIRAFDRMIANMRSGGPQANTQTDRRRNVQDMDGTLVKKDGTPMRNQTAHDWWKWWMSM